MELIRLAFRTLVFCLWPPRVQRASAQEIEQDARNLVQKLAREEAAINAVAVILRDAPQGSHDPDYVTLMVDARRRAETAILFSHVACNMLRESLGLPQRPTAAEVDGWGVSP